MKICVVGLGYVGLPLAIQFAQSNVEVVGLDTDEAKVDLIQKGQSYIKHIASETIARMIETKRLCASNDFGKIKEVDAVIICVPTPLTKNREPDISYVIETGRSIAPHLSKGTVVVLESTTYPGTTDEDLREVLETGSGMTAGSDFHLAFSPEGEDPGNPVSSFEFVPKVVGGYTPACLEKAMAIYSRAVTRSGGDFRGKASS
jgi:UDP-N-acetyl-D-glucosamine dehydrogenase